MKWNKKKQEATRVLEQLQQQFAALPPRTRQELIAALREILSELNAAAAEPAALRSA